MVSESGARPGLPAPTGSCPSAPPRRRDPLKVSGLLILSCWPRLRACGRGSLARTLRRLARRRRAAARAARESRLPREGGRGFAFQIRKPEGWRGHDWGLLQSPPDLLPAGPLEICRKVFGAEPVAREAQVALGGLRGSEALAKVKGQEWNPGIEGGGARWAT